MKPDCRLLGGTWDRWWKFFTKPIQRSHAHPCCHTRGAALRWEDRSIIPFGRFFQADCLSSKSKHPLDLPCAAFDRCTALLDMPVYSTSLPNNCYFCTKSNFTPAPFVFSYSFPRKSQSCFLHAALLIHARTTTLFLPASPLLINIKLSCKKCNLNSDFC